MNKQLFLTLAMAFTVVFAGLFFPFGSINLGIKSEAWWAPWPATILIGAIGTTVGISFRQSGRQIGTAVVGFLSLGYFVGCVAWLNRLVDSELWIGRGVGFYTLPVVAFIGLVIVPTARLANERRNN